MPELQDFLWLMIGLSIYLRGCWAPERMLFCVNSISPKIGPRSLNRRATLRSMACMLPLLLCAPEPNSSSPERPAIRQLNCPRMYTTTSWACNHCMLPGKGPLAHADLEGRPKSVLQLIPEY